MWSLRSGCLSRKSRRRSLGHAQRWNAADGCMRCGANRTRLSSRISGSLPDSGARTCSTRRSPGRVGRSLPYAPSGRSAMSRFLFVLSRKVGYLFSNSFLKERGRSRPRLVVFSLVCELPDPGWRVEIGVGGQGSGGARPRKRPQGLDGDAVRRTLFRTGESKRLVLLSACGTGGRCRLQGRFPGVGQARGCWVIPSPRVGGLKRFAGDGRTGSIRRNGHAGIGGHELHDPRRP